MASKATSARRPGFLCLLRTASSFWSAGNAVERAPVSDVLRIPPRLLYPYSGEAGGERFRIARAPWKELDAGASRACLQHHGLCPLPTPSHTFPADSADVADAADAADAAASSPNPPQLGYYTWPTPSHTFAADAASPRRNPQHHGHYPWHSFALLLSADAASSSPNPQRHPHYPWHLVSRPLSAVAARPEALNPTKSDKPAGDPASSTMSRSPSALAGSPKPETLLEKYMNPALLSSADRHNLDLRRIRESFRRHNGDTGSSEVQIALLTERIRYMGAHLTTHKKDKHSSVGLQGMLARRRKLLKYLRRKDWDLYCQVILRLGLRDRVDLQT